VIAKYVKNFNESGNDDKKFSDSWFKDLGIKMNKEKKFFR
jgi:hypothetical protein